MVECNAGSWNREVQKKTSPVMNYDAAEQKKKKSWIGSWLERRNYLNSTEENWVWAYVLAENKLKSKLILKINKICV